MSLQLQIGADVSGAIQGINQVSTELNKIPTAAVKVTASVNAATTSLANTGKAAAPVIVLQQSVSKLGDTLETLKAKSLAKQEFIKTERDVAKIALLNKEIQALEAEIVRVQNIGKAGFDKLGNAATGALGGIGATATKAFGALRTIANILPGVGISTLLLAGWDLLSGKIGNAGEKAKEAQKAFQDLRDSAFKSVSGEAAQVTELVAVLKNETETRERKAGAIKKLNEIAPEYFGNLKKEGTSVNELTTDYNNYISGLEKAITFKLKEAELEGLISKKLTDQSKLKLLTPVVPFPEFKGLTQDQKDLQKEISITQGKIDEIFKVIDQDHKVKIDTKDAAKGLSELQRLLIKQAQDAVKVFNIKPELQISDLDTEKEKLKKALEIIGGIKAFTIKARVDIDLPDIKELPQEKIEKIFQNVPSALQDAIDKGLIEFKHGTEIPIIPDLSPFSKEITDVLNQFEKEGLKIPVVVGLKDADLLISLQKAFKKGLSDKKIGDDLKKSLDDVGKAFVLNLGESLGDSIGEAIASGGNVIQNAFKAIVSVIGDLIKQIGKALVAYGATKIKLDAIIAGGFGLPGAVALAAGLAAIALGQLVKSSQVQGRERGGPVEAGKPYIVGEKRPELFVPKTAGTIIPYVPQSFTENNHSLSSAINSSSFSKSDNSLSNSVNSNSFSNQRSLSNSVNSQKEFNRNVSNTSVFNSHSFADNRTITTNNLTNSFSSNKSNESQFGDAITNLSSKIINSQVRSESNNERSFTDNRNSSEQNSSVANSIVNAISSSQSKSESKLNESVNNLSTVINTTRSLNNSAPIVNAWRQSSTNINNKRDNFSNLSNILSSNNLVNNISKSISESNINSMVASVPVMDSGGITTGPTLALLSKNFKSEVVLPVDRIKDLIGGQSEQNIKLQGQFRLSNRDLLLAIARGENGNSFTT